MRPRNLVGIAVAVAVIFFAAQWIPSSSNGNLAFAQMQQLVAKTKSVQYTEVRTDRFGKSTSETRAKVKVLGTSIERREVTNKEENLPEGSISTTALGSYISINDAKQGKIITLYPDKRAFVMIRGTMSVTDDGQVKSEPTKADPKADFYARISEVPIDPMKRLPERMIDGKKAVGFVVEEKREGQNNVDIFHRTYWIDPVTKLPIRIEATFRSTRPDSVESDWVKSDFVFDAQLDEALFSLAPPPGYTEIGKPDGNAKPTVPPGKPGG